MFDENKSEISINLSLVVTYRHALQKKNGQKKYFENFHPNLRVHISQ